MSIELNNELLVAMRKFKEVFGDIVPLRELPQDISNEELLEALSDSIEQGRDLLAERFGFAELEKDKNILM